MTEENSLQLLIVLREMQKNLTRIANELGGLRKEVRVQGQAAAAARGESSDGS